MKYKRWIWCLLCSIDNFSKYPWVAPLINKNGTKMTTTFRKVLDDSNSKPNKIKGDKSSKV